MTQLIAQRPEPGTPRPYRFPAVVRRSVAGGSVVAADLPGHNLAVASLLLDAGGGRETIGVEGVAEVLAKALEEGTASRSAADYAVALESLGTDLSLSIDWDSFAATVQVPVAALPAAVELLAEAVRRPKLDPADIERVRDDEAESLRLYWANPGPRADAVLRSDLFGAEVRHGRPLSGDPRTVGALSVDDVVGFHRSWFMAPGTLLVAGDLSRIDLDALGRAAFAGADESSPVVGEPFPAGGRTTRRIVLVDRPGSVQSTLRLGHTAPHRSHPDYVPMTLGAIVLGGAFTSRLNHLLREVRGYTYGIRSEYGLSRRFGRFVTSAGVQTAVTAPALVDAVGEIARTQSEGVTEPELAVARDWRAGQLSVGLQTPRAYASALSTLVVHDLPDDYHARLRESLLHATVDEVSAATAAHLNAEGITLVVEGDAAAIRSELEATGLGEVVTAAI
ncbi:peptidase M16 [Asanoa ishikariensis]|uniref:Predicted Zn-dependent peptidase n=1 Tax=Asanoa ishikariensis TaxID=137265 RepID=A0A1H3N3Z4_9ACTN|nr:pitrilysin family protein [Asanoa ishikariensis]GIF68869.1 peptidase M16 [Asanoa ishikariensis]SDY83556.1 Predicted Zn-dependent peptidase [Asanoa ishikariensis]